MRRPRSWTAPADFVSVAGDPLLLPTALRRVEDALDAFPAGSPGCIGYMTPSKLFCGVGTGGGRGARHVRLHRLGPIDGPVMIGSKPVDDTIVRVSGNPGDRLAGLVPEDTTSGSMLRLVLEAARSHMRDAIARAVGNATIADLEAVARTLAAATAGREQAGMPRVRASLATPWGGVRAVAMLLGSGDMENASGLLDARARRQAATITAVEVSCRMKAFSSIDALSNQGATATMVVEVRPFRADLHDVASLGATELMRVVGDGGAARAPQEAAAKG